MDTGKTDDVREKEDNTTIIKKGNMKDGGKMIYMMEKESIISWLRTWKLKENRTRTLNNNSKIDNTSNEMIMDRDNH